MNSQAQVGIFSSVHPSQPALPDLFPDLVMAHGVADPEVPLSLNVTERFVPK